MSFLIDGKWLDAPKGSFVLVPAGAGIVEWFAEHPPVYAGR